MHIYPVLYILPHFGVLGVSPGGQNPITFLPRQNLYFRKTPARPFRRIDVIQSAALRRAGQQSRVKQGHACARRAIFHLNALKKEPVTLFYPSSPPPRPVTGLARGAASPFPLKFLP